MKRVTSIMMFLTVLGSTFYIQSEDFAVKLEPEWKDLDQNPEKERQFGGKWILVGNIIFKKKSKECVSLNRLHLKWKGGHIEKLIGSLYQKNLDKKFIPIEDFLVCDGIWNKKEQTLILNFDRRCSLSAVNVFHLVLTVPRNIEPILKKGSFTITHHCLPRQFKECVANNNLSLSFTNITTKKITMH